MAAAGLSIIRNLKGFESGPVSLNTRRTHLNKNGSHGRRTRNTQATLVRRHTKGLLASSTEQEAHTDRDGIESGPAQLLEKVEGITTPFCKHRYESLRTNNPFQLQCIPFGEEGANTSLSRVQFTFRNAAR